MAVELGVRYHVKPHAECQSKSIMAFVRWLYVYGGYVKRYQWSDPNTRQEHATSFRGPARAKLLVQRTLPRMKSNMDVSGCA